MAQTKEEIQRKKKEWCINNERIHSKYLMKGGSTVSCSN